MYFSEYSIRNAGFAIHRIWDIEYRGRYESIHSRVQQDRTPVDFQKHCQFNVTLIPKSSLLERMLRSAIVTTHCTDGLASGTA